MTTIRRFCCNDLLRFASVNLDRLSVTFSMEVYMNFLVWWPKYFLVAEAPGNRMMGYVMGNDEGEDQLYHGHINAMAFASEYRTKELAKNLMNQVEYIFDYIDHAYFVDLYVRASNSSAIKMYEKLGYVIYRRMERYYFGEEDALNMRKALSQDKEKKSIIPLVETYHPH